MKILYIHGFGSKFDSNHVKIQALETLGKVIGINVDYCKGFKSVFKDVIHKVTTEKVSLIVGTSMGGYMAALVGSTASVPFVALNPATSPSNDLLQWEGIFTDYNGESHYLSESIISNYPDIVTEGWGLIIVESGDEVISANDTINKLSDYFQVEKFSGGEHQFTHIDKAIPLIEQHYLYVVANYKN
jgi:predicted esterase YcpF (UPF0227 family)